MCLINGHVGPPNMFPIELRMVILWAFSAKYTKCSKYNTCLLASALGADLTTYHSNIGVQLRSLNELGKLPLYVFIVSYCRMVVPVKGRLWQVYFLNWVQHKHGGKACEWATFWMDMNLLFVKPFLAAVIMKWIAIQMVVRGRGPALKITILTECIFLGHQVISKLPFPQGLLSRYNGWPIVISVMTG